MESNPGRSHGSTMVYPLCHSRLLLRYGHIAFSNFEIVFQLPFLKDRKSFLINKRVYFKRVRLSCLIRVQRRTQSFEIIFWF